MSLGRGQPALRGVLAGAARRRASACAYGDHVLDLAAALHDEVFAAPTLNAFMARGRTAWRDTRAADHRTS